MKIMKKVIVKQILTKASKKKLRERFEHQKMRLELESQQILFEQRKLQNKLGITKEEVTNRFKEEINQRKEQKNMIDFKLEQLDILDIGSELVEKEVEALVEVKVGSHWDELMNDQAIIIKDDIVVEIEN